MLLLTRRLAALPIFRCRTIYDTIKAREAGLFILGAVLKIRNRFVKGIVE